MTTEAKGRAAVAKAFADYVRARDVMKDTVAQGLADYVRARAVADKARDAYIKTLNRHAPSFDPWKERP